MLTSEANIRNVPVTQLAAGDAMWTELATALAQLEEERMPVLVIRQATRRRLEKRDRVRARQMKTKVLCFGMLVGCVIVWPFYSVPRPV
jgi:hypothetical protein